MDEETRQLVTELVTGRRRNASALGFDEAREVMRWLRSGAGERWPRVEMAVGGHLLDGFNYGRLGDEGRGAAAVHKPG